MSGMIKLKPPKNDAEWARNTEKRLNAAENTTSIRVGEWVLSTSADTGNLIASHVDGGSVVLAVKPAASANPDEILDSAEPYIKVERQQNQAEARGSVHLVQWDTVASQTAEWGFSAPGTDLDVSENGIYEIIFHLAFLNSSSAVHKGLVYINGSAVMAQELNPHVDDPWYVGMYLADTFALNSGDIISAGAYVSGSGTFDFGTSGADAGVHTSMSIRLISKRESDD